MYTWRKLTEQQRAQLLARRKKLRRPWHTPPHFEPDTRHSFHLTAACYEHAPLIGSDSGRLSEFESALVDLLSSGASVLHAWCVLPNHWHALIHTDDLLAVVKQVGRLHGRTSFQWNQEDGAKGRTCWHGCSDRRIRSVRHFYVVRNYIHHNPVKHGYVEKWEDWPYSSAREFIEQTGRDEVLRQWRDFPVLEMGRDWDD
ncbi:transposase [Pontiella sp.]|uniref:transposase n=1 Tax=Pontiella sp. TaxID=2837462 RepID=UPI003568649D